MPGFPPTPPGFTGTVLVDLNADHPEFLAVEDEVRAFLRRYIPSIYKRPFQMQSTIVEHKDNGVSGGTFNRYRVLKVIDCKH